MILLSPSNLLYFLLSPSGLLYFHLTSGHLDIWISGRSNPIDEEDEDEDEDDKPY